MGATRSEPGRWPSCSPPDSCSPRSARCPVVVFWDDDTAFAIEDRCPHLGFPLHQGTVEAGLVTCHWHHARFDLVLGLHARPVGRRRPRLRRATVAATTCSSARACDARPRRAPAARLATGSRTTSRSCREVGARPPRSGRARVGDRAHAAWSSARATATPAGAPASPCSSRWPTSFPSSNPTTARSRSCTDSRSSRATRANHAPRFPVGALETQDVPGRPPRATGTAASSTRVRPTRPSARSRPRSPSRAGSATSRR